MMKAIYHNGIIRTPDKPEETSEAVYIENGIIKYIGSDDEALLLADANTKKHDMQGGLLLPGFRDSHCHLLETVSMRNCLDLSHTESLEDLIILCRDNIPKSGWLKGFGFDNTKWSDTKMPTRHDLDRACEGHPIAITRKCLHVTVLNTAALKLLNILNRFPDGLLYENEQNIIKNTEKHKGQKTIKDMIISGCKMMAEKGIVQVHTEDFNAFENGNYLDIIDAYKDLALENELSIRIYQQCALDSIRKLDEFMQNGYKTGFSIGKYKIGPLKLFLDGSLGAETAALRTPYVNNKNNKGVLIYSTDELYSILEHANQNDMQVAVHCIGDRAIDECLKNFSRIVKTKNYLRHGIVHSQITDMDIIERFAEDDILAYVQPLFVSSDMGIIKKCISDELASTSNNWRAFIDRGVHISGGSDSPVESFNPLEGIACAVNRTDGEKSSPWFPENCISVNDAVKMYSSEGAYASFEEKERGGISIGQFADLVLLDRDIYSCSKEDINRANVLRTIVEGKEIYSVC